MKLKYSAQWLPDYGVTFSPRVSAVFTNPKTGMSLPVFCLVDSGSAQILMNPQIGEALGIDITSGEVASYGGINGSVIGYKHSLKFRLAGDTQECEVECAFAPIGSVEGLLGQTGFFDNYKVVFEKYENQFEVIPQPAHRNTSAE
jgi:hypothetical protein